MKTDTLKDLGQEIDYQLSYDYEKRADLFNKYFVSTSTKYINPIMMLATHIRRMGDEYSKYECRPYPGMSHSGAVETAFNKEIKTNTNKYATLIESDRLVIFKIFNYHYDKKEFIPVFLFKQDKETSVVSFKLQNTPDFFPKRGFCFYECAEEWCKDFGFNLNFRK